MKSKKEKHVNKHVNKVDVKANKSEGNKPEVSKEVHQDLHMGRDNLKPNEVREVRGHFYSNNKWTPN